MQYVVVVVVEKVVGEIRKSILLMAYAVQRLHIFVFE